MAKREIVLDTETTGLDPVDGHRIVEIACVELINLVPTGKELHRYCNPQRDMPEDAIAVHGLTTIFLADKPCFHDLAEELLDFIAEAPIVAHNAEFDLRFLQAELGRCARPLLTCAMVDTLQIARSKFPGSPASLDALCRRFGIDLTEREKHGALVDTRLLARVYLELMGGKEPGLALNLEAEITVSNRLQRQYRAPRPHAPSPDELAAHSAFLQSIKEPLWLYGE